jgi:carbonic anhydrase
LEKKAIQVHGWVYDMHDGQIKELTHADDTLKAVHPIFKYHMD